MKILKEYRLKKVNFAEHTFYIHKNAEIAGVVDRDFDVAIIAVCDYPVSIETELHTFKIYCSNDIICEDNVKYIGCVGNQHVVEIL